MGASIEILRAVARAMLRAPRPLLRGIAGPPRRSPGGLTLDLEVQALLRVNDLLRRPRIDGIGVEGGRRFLEETSAILTARPRGALAVSDRAIPGASGSIGARVYVPERAGRPLPVVVYYHGGGFVMGSLASHDDTCRELALGAGALVVSIDYRLAPEHRFPAAVDDGVAAFRWVAANAASLGGDASRIAVAGDSAGGNVAAVVARDTRADAVAPCFQLLVYPLLDCARRGSRHAFADGLILDDASLAWFLDQYFGPGDDRSGPRASPLLAGDHGGVAPAMILTAGFDPLCDEGAAYAGRLEAAGVPVEHLRHDGLAHGFLGMPAGVREARRAVDDTVAGLRRGLTRGR